MTEPSFPGPLPTEPHDLGSPYRCHIPSEVFSREGHAWMRPEPGTQVWPSDSAKREGPVNEHPGPDLDEPHEEAEPG